VSFATRRLLVSVAFAAIGFVLALTWREYRLELSIVTGVAVGLLAFATLRTVERMRETLRR
jgi:hypothetical protein